MLDDFITYLQKNEYAPSTIESYSNVVNHFLKWCSQNNYETEGITYDIWLRYQSLIKNRITKKGTPLKDKSVSHEIGIIRQFFDFLVFEDIIDLNPIKDQFYKSDSDFYHQLLTEEELHELYFCYPTIALKHPKCPSVAIRNKVIIGLVVYQAIDPNTLRKLTIDDIDLNKRKIYVPGTKRSNSRTLDLKDVQMNVLRQYLELDRAVLQRKINCFTEALFPLNTSRFSCITSDLTGKLKALNLKVTNLKQLRASVITLWTQKHDLRKTQVMAGHRFISSTENYLKTDLNSLEEATKMYHPMQ